MEVSVDKFFDGLVIATDIGTQGSVVESTQLSDDAVDHCWTEHIVLLIDGTLLLKAIGAGNTAVGELSKSLEACFVFLVMDIDINIGALSNI